MSNIFIALGSNLENPKEQVKEGILSIKKIEGVKILRKSSLYETPPVGVQINLTLLMLLLRLIRILDHMSFLIDF